MAPSKRNSYRFALPFLIQLVLAIHPTALGKDSSGMTYQIKTTWDGLPVDHDPVSVTLVGKEEGVEILVDAPFFGIPGNPGGKPGEPFDKLWEYEVRTLLPIQFESTINSGRWTGKAMIPASYFPPGVTRFNAYAIHDVEHNSVDDPRRYESLFPTPTDKYPSANFHRLEYFQPLDFDSLQPGNKNATLSDPWPHKEVTAKYYLMGGKLSDNTSSLTVTGVSSNESAYVEILSRGFLHEGAESMGATGVDPLPDENLDRYETMRFYLANEKRRLLEIIFSPNGRYDVKMFEEPYKRVSRGHRLTDVVVMADYEEKTWNVTAKVPLELVPASVSRVGLAAVYGGVNGTDPIYETTYYVTNAGICITDLYVVKQYPQVTGLLNPALNEGYSDLWGLDDKGTLE
ncbi:hypothetical protein J437_LFUL011717 [Ladona fulva]|uniref:Uncharacterized protein n=1 Tax=Ladona fulva TaxID=123851 RepID=A0A8K0KA27_LADFU|nr:hypothetical protein J437_LFUL011717 [Ladona fulva]